MNGEPHEESIENTRVIKFWRSTGLRNGHEMIAAKISSLAFHAALLMPLARRAEGGLELPVRAEGDEPIRLFAPPPAQNSFDRARQVVVPQLMKDATKIAEDILMRGEKGPLRRRQVAPIKRRPAPQTAQRKELQREALSRQRHSRLIPIALRLESAIVGLRDENFAARLAVGQFPKLHVFAHRALGDRM